MKLRDLSLLLVLTVPAIAGVMTFQVSGSSGSGGGGSIVTNASLVGNGTAGSPLGVNSSSVAVFSASGDLNVASSVTAGAFYGDGSNLTGLPASNTATSSFTVQGSAFSVGGSTLTVGNGQVFINGSTYSGSAKLAVNGSIIFGFGATNDGTKVSTLTAAGAVNLADNVSANVVGFSSITTTGGLFGGSLSVSGAAVFNGSATVNGSAGLLVSTIAVTNILGEGSGVYISTGITVSSETVLGSFLVKGVANFNNTANANAGLNVTGNFVVGTSTLVVKNGLVGIGTTNPTTALSVYGIITSSTVIPTVACTLGTPTMTPGSTSQAGSYTAGNGATGCTVTFAQNFNSTPFCFCQATANLLVYASASATNSVTCTAATAMTGDTINYFCWGPP